MEKEFCTYNQALRLKALGFDEPCFGLWNINNGKYQVDVIGTCKYSENFKYREVLAPTFSQAFRWFREKYSLIAEFNWHFPSKCYATSIYPNDFYLQTKNYEEAELACLDKLLEIVESKSE